MNVLLVAAGAFLGALARFYVSKKLSERFQSAIPYGTLTVNLTGSLVLGFLLGAYQDSPLIWFAGTGFLGSFTTFSTLMVESLGLVKNSGYRLFLFYLTATCGLGVGLAFIGYYTGRLL